MERVADPPITFDQLNRNAQPYPGHLLPEGGTGLALFAAGFHGWNDVIHMARKHMAVHCVDVDADKLWDMLSADGELMPAKKGQTPPSLRYFNQSK
jgi:hypothetical protein